MDIQIYKIEDIPAALYKQCYSLNMRQGGQMRRLLSDKDFGSYAYIGLEENKVLAWAIVKQNLKVHIYVRRSHRRRGLGTQLMNSIKSVYGNKLWHYKWNSAARSFFSSVGLSDFYDLD